MQAEKAQELEREHKEAQEKAALRQRQIKQASDMIIEERRETFLEKQRRAGVFHWRGCGVVEPRVGNGDSVSKVRPGLAD